MTYELRHLKLTQVMQLGSALRSAGKGAATMEGVANRVVHMLYDAFTDPGSGTRNCALVRIYLSMNYSELDDELRAFGANLMQGDSLGPSTRCLTLVATCGEQPDWNSRRTSTGHKCIPLPSTHVIQAIPMISQLIQQLGIDLSTVVKPDFTLILEQEQRSYNVFHVSEAAGSPYIPAQSELFSGTRSVPCWVSAD